jgi:hypothetical protein
MGMFAGTAVVDYCLSFADHGKELPFSICSKQTEVAVSISSVFRLQAEVICLQIDYAD